MGAHFAHDAEAPVRVIGAGPAGLAAALRLARGGVPVVVHEAAPEVGGLCRTVRFAGCGFDIGGHRLFTKHPEVSDLWEAALGDALVTRPRRSAILYGGRRFSYPLNAREALTGLGPREGAGALLSYAKARISPPRTDTFAGWVTSRFGSRLYEAFFRTYTEKVWGLPCADLSPDWAAQRIQTLSLGKAVADALGVRRGPLPKSLVGEFRYPRLGPGQLMDALAAQVREAGGEIALSSPASGLRTDGERVSAVEIDGGPPQAARAVLSAAPLPHLAGWLSAPPNVQEHARALRFRHLRVVMLVLDGEAPFAEQWIYVHSPELAVARVQNMGAWSPDLVAPGTAALALEYFTGDGLDRWTCSDEALIDLALRELLASGLCDLPVRAAAVVRAPRAYPVYDRAYRAHLDPLLAFVRSIQGLQVMGRYGMFRYNNSDHAVLTGLYAAENLLFDAGHDLFAVNAEARYHEAG